MSSRQAEHQTLTDTGTHTNSSAKFHPFSRSVLFSVNIGNEIVNASISREILHYRYHPASDTDQPLETYQEHAIEIEEAVRRRVDAGARDFVVLRYYDVI